jgi:hypothetical protein
MFYLGTKSDHAVVEIASELQHFERVTCFFSLESAQKQSQTAPNCSPNQSHAYLNKVPLEHMHFT